MALEMTLGSLDVVVSLAVMAFLLSSTGFKPASGEAVSMINRGYVDQRFLARDRRRVPGHSVVVRPGAADRPDRRNSSLRTAGSVLRRRFRRQPRRAGPARTVRLPCLAAALAGMPAGSPASFSIMRSISSP